eukprot:2160287-Pleurochrysis_carterae.AAC.1
MAWDVIRATDRVGRTAEGHEPEVILVADVLEEGCCVRLGSVGVDWLGGLHVALLRRLLLLSKPAFFAP